VLFDYSGRLEILHRDRARFAEFDGSEKDAKGFTLLDRRIALEALDNVIAEPYEMRPAAILTDVELGKCSFRRRRLGGESVSHK